MWYQIKSYINFLLKSKNQHGVHSPFVYDLVTKCFYDKTNYEEYQQINSFRNSLLQNNNTIEITDFGVGSKVFKSDKRIVSAIAKNAGVSAKRQQLLFRLVRYFNSESILELGTSLGLATIAMSRAKPSATIKTVEGCENTSKIAQEYFDRFGLKNIQLYTTTFEDYFTKNPSEKYDLIYIDGSHNKEKTLRYFEILLKSADDHSVLIFDDIYWSASMNEAWQQIINHPKVIVSIDIFYWGLVFFSRNQQKQHFTIRL